jgi:hypothetical protein
MPRTAPMPPLAIVAISLTSVFAAFALVAIGLVWAACAVLFPPANPNKENRAVVTKTVTYDPERAEVTCTLERHYDWTNTTPIDVTFVARTPGGPTDGVVVTVRRNPPQSGRFGVALRGETAAAFAHPDAKRTVSLRRADGQLIQEEVAW